MHLAWGVWAFLTTGRLAAALFAVCEYSLCLACVCSLFFAWGVCVLNFVGNSIALRMFQRKERCIAALAFSKCGPPCSGFCKEDCNTNCKSTFYHKLLFKRFKTSIYKYVFWYVYILWHVSHDSITPQSFIQALCDLCSLKAQEKGYTTILDVMKQNLEGVSSAYLQN